MKMQTGVAAIRQRLNQYDHSMFLPERGTARAERFNLSNKDNGNEPFALNKRQRRLNKGIPVTDRFGKLLNKDSQ